MSGSKGAFNGIHVSDEEWKRNIKMKGEKAKIIFSFGKNETYVGDAIIFSDGTFVGTGPLEKISGIEIEFGNEVRETTLDDLYNIPDFRTFESCGGYYWRGRFKNEIR